MVRGYFQSSTMAIVALCFVLGFSEAAHAQSRFRRDILEERPCGPDFLRGPLRYLIPQGWGGADFKPACRRHDRCYETWTLRKECDERFRKEMYSACDSARCPRACRCVAWVMYATVRLFGAGTKTVGH